MLALQLALLRVHSPSEKHHRLDVFYPDFYAFLRYSEYCKRRKLGVGLDVDLSAFGH